MRKAIEEKVSSLLDSSLDNESQVVHLLVLVRKLLDEPRWKGRFRFLRMYCHWAVHVELSEWSTVGEFLAPLEAWLRATVRIDEEPPGFRKDSRHTEAEADFADQLQMLSSFRSDLGIFLDELNLSSGLCSEESRWSTFFKFYCEVITDGTLVIRQAEKYGSAIDRVTFKKAPADSETPNAPFALQWDIELRRGGRLIATFATDDSQELVLVKRNYVLHLS